MTEPQGAAPRPEPDVVHQGFLSLLALGIGVLLILAGGVVGVSMGMRGGSHTMMWGGPTERVQQAAAVPDAASFQIDGLPGWIVEQYGFAAENQGTLAQIPCFCGCQEMLGHRDLAQCFVTPDGAWESHAAGCQICVEESQMVMRMMGRGMGPDLMRERIVAAFGGSTMGMS